jgi:hypothetical protein
MPFAELIGEKLKKDNQGILEIAENLKNNHQGILKKGQHPVTPMHQRDRSGSGDTFGTMNTISKPKPDNDPKHYLIPELNSVEEESQEGEREFEDDANLQGTSQNRAGARRISKASLGGVGDSPKVAQADAQSQYSKITQIFSMANESDPGIRHIMGLKSSEDKMNDILSRFEDERNI